VTSLSDFSLFFRELRHVDGIKCAGRWSSKDVQVAARTSRCPLTAKTGVRVP
jgi:hypothetical protein